MNVHANTVTSSSSVTLVVLSVMVVFALPAEAQGDCTFYKNCPAGTFKPISEPGNSGNECNDSCGDCTGTCGPFCESQVDIRIGTNRRLLLATQPGSNQIQVRRGIDGRELIRGIVSLGLPPAGMGAAALADLRIAMRPSVSKWNSAGYTEWEHVEADVLPNATDFFALTPDGRVEIRDSPASALVVYVADAMYLHLMIWPAAEGARTLAETGTSVVRRRLELPVAESSGAESFCCVEQEEEFQFHAVDK